MIGWERETAQEISAEDWWDMVSNMHKCTRSVSIKETVVYYILAGTIPLTGYTEFTHWFLTQRMS